MPQERVNKLTIKPDIKLTENQAGITLILRSLQNNQQLETILSKNHNLSLTLANSVATFGENTGYQTEGIMISYSNSKHLIDLIYTSQSRGENNYQGGVDLYWARKTSPKKKISTWTIYPESKVFLQFGLENIYSEKYTDQELAQQLDSQEVSATSIQQEIDQFILQYSQ